MSTTTISIKKTQYKHSVIARGEQHNNRTRYFKLLKAALGSDHTRWLDDQVAYRAAEQLAHTTIYGRDLNDYTQPRISKRSGEPLNGTGGGLELQVQFLVQAPTQLSNTRQTRQRDYELAVASAIDAGVITAEQAVAWRLGIPESASL